MQMIKKALQAMTTKVEEIVLSAAVQNATIQKVVDDALERQKTITRKMINEAMKSQTETLTEILEEKLATMKHERPKYGKSYLTLN